MAGVVWNCCFDLDHGFGKGWGEILDFKVPSSFSRGVVLGLLSLRSGVHAALI